MAAKDKKPPAPKSEPALKDPQYGKQIAALEEEIAKIKAALGSALGVVVE